MNPMVSRRCVLLALLAMNSTARARDRLVISQTLPGDGYLDVLAQRLLTEAYKRLDIAVAFEPVPSERSLLPANEQVVGLGVQGYIVPGGVFTRNGRAVFQLPAVQRLCRGGEGRNGQPQCGGPERRFEWHVVS